MIRTQIQLTEEQARRLRRRAKDEGVSLAEVIRRYVDEGLSSRAIVRSDLYRRASELIGRFPDTKEARDLAREHDRYLDDAFR